MRSSETLNRGRKPAPCSLRKVATRLLPCSWLAPTESRLLHVRLSSLLYTAHLRGSRRTVPGAEAIKIQAEARAGAPRWGRCAEIWQDGCFVLAQQLYLHWRRFNLAEYVKVATAGVWNRLLTIDLDREILETMRAKSKSAAACASQSSEQKTA